MGGGGAWSTMCYSIRQTDRQAGWIYWLIDIYSFCLNLPLFLILSLNADKRKEELLWISRQNQALYQRLTARQSEYRRQLWLDDWERAERWREDISRHPRRPAEKQVKATLSYKKPWVIDSHRRFQWGFLSAEVTQEGKVCSRRGQRVVDRRWQVLSSWRQTCELTLCCFVCIYKLVKHQSVQPSPPLLQWPQFCKLWNHEPWCSNYKLKLWKKSSKI